MGIWETFVDLYRADDYAMDLGTRMRNVSEGLIGLFNGYSAVDATKRSALDAVQFVARANVIKQRFETLQTTALKPVVDAAKQAGGVSVALESSQLQIWHRSFEQMQDDVAGLNQVFKAIVGYGIRAAEKVSPPWRCDLICWGKIALGGAAVWALGSYFGWWKALKGK